MTLRPGPQGIEEGGRSRRARISGVKAARAALTQRPEGVGASVSKAGMGIAPG